MDTFLFYRNYTRQTSGTAVNREAASFVNRAVRCEQTERQRQHQDEHQIGCIVYVVSLGNRTPQAPLPYFQVSGERHNAFQWDLAAAARCVHSLSEREKDRRLNLKHQRKFSLWCSLSLGLNTALRQYLDL